MDPSFVEKRRIERRPIMKQKIGRWQPGGVGPMRDHDQQILSDCKYFLTSKCCHQRIFFFKSINTFVHVQIGTQTHTHANASPLYIIVFRLRYDRNGLYLSQYSVLHMAYSAAFSNSEIEAGFVNTGSKTNCTVFGDRSFYHFPRKSCCC